MATLNDRYEQGRQMRERLAHNNHDHYHIAGVDELAPDLRRIIDEALFGVIWTREGLAAHHRSMCTISAMTALSELSLLRRHVERGLNIGLTPEQVVEIFVHLTFYVGVPAVESGLELVQRIFSERGIQFTPPLIFNAGQTADELHRKGQAAFEESIGGASMYPVDDPQSVEADAQRFIEEYHWGAIYSRPTLDAKSRAFCALSAMTVKGQYDRQIRRRIEGALRVGATPREVMEVFMHLILYGGYINSRTAMNIARSVFNEQGLTA